MAQAFESSAEAADLGADTIDQQLRALDSFATFQDAIRSVGGDLNDISANNEIALGEFNDNRAAYERVLTSLRPFAEDLAALLAGTRPDIDTYLEQGDSVVRLLTANEDHLTEVIEGLGQYVQAFGGGLSQERLPDGSGFAYFKNFVYVGDVEAFLCSELANAPDEFGALRDALLSLQTEIDCTGYYEAAPRRPGPSAPPQIASARPAGGGRPPASSTRSTACSARPRRRPTRTCRSCSTGCWPRGRRHEAPPGPAAPGRPLRRSGGAQAGSAYAVVLPRSSSAG